MELAIHLGAHCTDADRLQKTLLRNRADLAAQGVAVPDPEDYRAVLREVMNRLRGAPADEGARDVLLEAFGTDAGTRRVVLSNANFISMPSRVIEEGQIYPRIAKAAWLRNLLPEATVSFYLAIRNPATFLPDVFQQTGAPESGFPAYLEQAEPEILRWSDTVAALRAACPDCAVTVWCHEDTPLFWSDVIHRIAGVAPEVPLKGIFDMLRPVMTPEGMKRLRAYTKANPPRTAETRRRIMTAFLDKFAAPDAMIDARVLPGWTMDLVARLSEIYESDVDGIVHQSGVTLLPD